MARTALHDDVLDALGRRIVGGELAVGAVLTLDVIDTEYDVSRSVSREAVRVLESMGMVDSEEVPLTPDLLEKGILISPDTLKADKRRPRRHS